MGLDKNGQKSSGSQGNSHGSDGDQNGEGSDSQGNGGQNQQGQNGQQKGQGSSSQGSGSDQQGQDGQQSGNGSQGNGSQNKQGQNGQQSGSSKGNSNGAGQQGQSGSSDGNGQGEDGDGNQSGSKSGEGADGQNGNGNQDGSAQDGEPVLSEDGYPVYRVSVGSDWGSSDMISIQDGMKVIENEGQIDNIDVSENPIDRWKRIYEEVKGKLSSVGNGTDARGQKGKGEGMSLEERLKEIEKDLAPGKIKWRSLLMAHFRNLGVKPSYDYKMKRSRFAGIDGKERADRFMKIVPKRKEEKKRNTADIFYLVDNSGSISEDELSIVFRELMSLERTPTLDIRKCAFTYFSDDFLDNRIRVWDRDTPDKKKMKLITRVPGEDPSGGTNIGKSVVHVTELKKLGGQFRDLYSSVDPRTLIIVFTDGIDNTWDIIGKLPQYIKDKILFVIMNVPSGSWGFESIVPSIVACGIPERNIICINKDTDLPTK